MNYLRIKKKKEITGILKNGKRAYAGSLTVAYLPAKETRMAVCVGKKYGKSTQRNYIKRILREAFRLHAAGLKSPNAFLLIPKVMESYSFARFAQDVGKILERERLIEHQHPTTHTAECEIPKKDGV
ncbi:MAG: ribonuclease P protein component [Clostridia bacterium]|nr:ribonuclease P protein component [Clostridia bacterium]